ncbi:Bromodomain protein, partial [Opisthorchis viverrini]
MAISQSPGCDSPGTNTEVVLARELLDSLMSRANAPISYPFMEEVDPDVLGLKDYRKIVKEPMWLKKMAEKFANGVYQNIREFVCDFRLMLLNCYRYNGVSSRMGRCAEKLELLFEQKLQLMPQEIRTKTSIQATLGGGTAEEELSDAGIPRRRSSSRLFLAGDSRQLTPMRAIMEELEHTLEPGTGLTAVLVTASTDLSKFASNNLFNSSMQSLSTATTAEERVAILIARLTYWNIRRQDEALLTSWDSWWTEQQGPELIDVAQNTQELLETYQFLWLADPFLGLTESLVYFTPQPPVIEVNPAPARNLGLLDLEFALTVAPRASLLLATCMSHLLATIKERGRIVAVLSTADGPTGDPIQDPSNDSRRLRGTQSRVTSCLSPLEYDVWERRLAARVTSWYRALWDKGKGNPIWATRRLGLPPKFFHRCGFRQSPLDSKRFHELPVYIRIQLFYALCETVLRSFDNLRLSMERDAGWEAAAPVLLGEDIFSSVTYIHFPGMLDSTAATLNRVYRVSRLKSGPVDLQQQSNKSSPSPATELEPVASEKSGFDSSTTEPLTVCKVEHQASSSSSEEPVEIAVPTRATRGKRSRKRKFTHKKNHSQLESSAAEHNRLIAEYGIDVPGPVGRLPRWIDPSLARSTCRRLHGIAGQLKALQSLGGATQEKSRGRKTSLLSFTTSLLERTFNAHGTGSELWSKSSGPIFLTAFHRLDSRKVAELTAEEPALVPSPFGTLCGMSRRYLSMQLSRSYYGPGMRNSKSNSSRRMRARARAKKLRETTAAMSEQDELASSTADADDADNSASSLSSSSTDEDRQTGDEGEEGEDEKPPSHANEVDDLNKPQQAQDVSTTCVCDADNQSKHENNEQDTSPSGADSNPTGQVDKVEETGDTPMSEVESGPKSAEETADPEEPMVTQPDRHEFSLIAWDTKSLKELLSELRTLLERAQRRLSDPNPSDCSPTQKEEDGTPSVDAFRLEASDSFSSVTDVEDGPDKDYRSKRQVVGRREHHSFGRLRRGIQMLKQLIRNLEQLETSMRSRHNECEDAQRLARLRLRKDVAVWQAKEDERVRKEAEAARLEEQKQQQSAVATAHELAKERAERLQRREMLRSIEYGASSDLDGEGDVGSRNSSPDYRPPGFSARTAQGTVKPPTFQEPVTSPRLSSTAFSCRFDKTGSPKMPIPRTGAALPQPLNHIAIGGVRPLNGPSNIFQPRVSPFSRVTIASPHPTFGVRFTGITPTRPLPAPHSATRQSTITVAGPMAQTNSPVTSSNAPPLSTPASVTNTHWSNSIPSANHVSQSPSVRPIPPPRKIYRVYDTLFTENATPVRINPDGTLHSLPLDSIPAHHRQVAVQMIARYKQHAAAGLAPATTPKRVSVTTGEPDPT